MHKNRESELGLEEAERVTSAIAAASLALGKSLDLSAVLSELLRCLSSLVPFDSGNVMLLEGEVCLSVFAHRGYENWTDPNLLSSVRFDVRQDGPLSQIYRTRESLLVHDTRITPGWRRTPGTEHVNSWLGVPLILGDKLLGVYSLDKNESGFFTSRHVRLAESMAAHAALAINNAQTYRDLEDKAIELERQVARREQAQRDLTQRETLLRSIIDNEPECVKLLSRDGSLLDMNPAGLAMIGAKSLEQVRGQCMFGLVLPEHRLSFKRLTEAVFHGGAGKLEFEVEALNGEHRWLETHALPLRDQTGEITSLLGITRDITESRQAEAALRNNERHLRDILDNLAAMVGIFTPEGIVLDANRLSLERAALRLEDVSGKELAETYWFNYAPDVQAQIREVFRRAGQGEVVSGDFRVRITHGFLDIFAIFTPLRDAGGAVTKVVGSALDITERKQTERALLESEHRLQMAVQAANIGLWEWDLATHAVYFSPQWTMLIGYEDHEMPSSFDEWRHLIHPDDLEPTLAKIKVFLDQPGGKYENEHRLRHKDGSYRWIYAIGNALRDESGRPVRMTGCHIDITDRKHAEQMIQESEARFRSLVEHAVDGIVLTTDSGHYTHANSSFLAMTGYTLDEFVQLHIRDVVAQDEKARVDSVVAEISSGARYSEEWRVRRKDGTFFAAEVNARRLPDGQLVAFVRDLTERKQNEERLRQAQKMEAVGQFAGGIAHDFNNLLMITSSYGELLKGLLQGEKEKHYADELLAASSRGAGLVRQLMAFSHKRVETPSSVDVNGVLRAVGEMVARLVGKSINLQVIPAATPCAVNIDQGQLEQIILNLSSNARDAMPNGGILTLEVIPLTLREDTCEHGVSIPAGAYALIAVSDSGCGIPAAIRAKIFDPFFTTKPTGKGTGLGLATVQDIVKRNGGRITVVSEPGLGSSFKIYLPLCAVERAVLQPEADVPGGLEHVLLVDDEAALRIGIGQYLRSKGYRVTEANSGHEAVRLAQATTFDVLVTDVMMPGMTGMDLANALHDSQPSLPVLFISGYTDGALQRTKRIEPGAVFLQKPFALDALATKLRSVIAPSAAPPPIEPRRSAHV